MLKIKRRYHCRECDKTWEDEQILATTNCPDCDSGRLDVRIIF